MLSLIHFTVPLFSVTDSSENVYSKVKGHLFAGYSDNMQYNSQSTHITL